MKKQTASSNLASKQWSIFASTEEKKKKIEDKLEYTLGLKSVPILSDVPKGTAKKL